MLLNDMFELVGCTPHVRVKNDLSERIYIKLESQNPTGSVKDRACVSLIRDALARDADDPGALRPGKILLDASSGNMACAIAYFGRILGYQARLFSSSKLTADKRAFIEYFGASLDITGTFTIEGNHACREIAEAEPERYCFLDQLHNWANPKAHVESTGPEILNAHPELSMVVASLGSGGSLYGTASFLKERLPDLVVVAVEAAAGTRLPGTGAFDDGDYITPFIQKGRDDGLFDHRIQVSYEQAAEATRRLRDQGIFTGIQTGGVFHSCLEAVRRTGVEGDVVFLAGDSGWKNMEKLAAL